MRRALRRIFWLVITLLPAALLGAQPARPPARDAEAQRLERPRPGAREVDVQRLQGRRTVLAAKQPLAVEADTKTVWIRPGEYVVGQWTDRTVTVEPTTARDAQAWMAGFGFIGLDTEGREVRFRPVIETSGGLIAQGPGFAGLVHVGLRDVQDPSKKYSLPQPIGLLVSGEADDLTPRQLTLGHINLPFEPVRVVSRDPADTVELTLQASGTTERATVAVPVFRPRLELFVAPPRIQGMGLETADVTVRAVGDSEPAGRVITISPTRGWVETMNLTLDQTGTATTSIRSAWLGTATVNASGAPFAPASESVEFLLPVVFLVAALLGGLAGAYLRHGWRMKAVLLDGGLTGIVVAALYAVGVNVLPFQPGARAGEALVFVVAAAGAYLGLSFGGTRTAPKD